MKRKVHDLLVRPSPDPLDRGLEFEWRFNEASGEFVRDYSGRNRHVTAVGTLWAEGARWEITPKGIGLRTGPHVHAPTNISIDQLGAVDVWTSITLEIYFLLNALSGDWPVTTVFGFTQTNTGGSTAQAGYQIRGDSATTRRVSLITDGANRFVSGIKAKPAVGDFVHHILTYDGAAVRGYREGVPDGSGAATGTIDDSQYGGLDEFQLSQSSGGFGHDATILHARCYRRALTASEVAERYRLVQMRMRPTINLFGVGAVVVTGDINVEVPAASIAITTYAPTATFTGNIDVEVPPASIQITTYAPTAAITEHIDVEVPSASIAITTYAPTAVFTEHIDVEVPPASIAITTYAPTVTFSGNIDVEVPAASIGISTYVPGVTITEHIDVTVPVASIAISTFAPGVTITEHIDVEVPVASIVITTYAPDVTFAGDIDVEVPTASIGITAFAPYVTITTTPVGFEYRFRRSYRSPGLISEVPGSESAGFRIINAGAFPDAGDWFSQSQKDLISVYTSTDWHPSHAITNGANILDGTTATEGYCTEPDLGDSPSSIFLLDMGEIVGLSEIRLWQPNHATDYATGIYIYVSETGDFGGEEVLVASRTSGIVNAAWNYIDFDTYGIGPTAGRYWGIRGFRSGATTNYWRVREIGFKWYPSVVFANVPYGTTIKAYDDVPALVEEHTQNNFFYSEAVQFTDDTIDRVIMYDPADVIFYDTGVGWSWSTGDVWTCWIFS